MLCTGGVSYPLTYTAAAKLMHMNLMRANPLLGLFEGVGPRNGFARIKIITSHTI
jgi:hypothetical protein